MAILILLAGLCMQQIVLATSQLDKLKASPVMGSAYFGHAVAMDGTTVVVGAYFESATGAAYVFDCSSYPCRQVSKLVASDAASNDYFGYSIAISGTRVVVGAANDSTAVVRSGSAYVFNLGTCGATCNEVGKLTASDATTDDQFGSGVAISGTTVVVGAGNSHSGLAYVFDLSTCGAACTETSQLAASDAASGDHFSTVAVGGTTALVGAYGDDNAFANTGSAYVFDLSTCGAACNEVSKLSASDAAMNDYFGTAVAIDGTMVAVGAPNTDASGAESGTVYVFDLGTCGAACNEISKLAASDAAVNDRLGQAVAINGTTIVAGARYTDGEGGDSGSVYVFDASVCGAACPETNKLTAINTAGLQLGTAVAVDGTMVVAGIPMDNDGGSYAGAAYVFDTRECEIDVQRPVASSIPDGGVDNINDLTMSGLPVGTVTLAYTIHNPVGPGPLSVAAASASNMANASNFTVVTDLPLLILVGESATLEFQLDVASVFSFDLAIRNTDSDENPYNIHISGTANAVSGASTTTTTTVVLPGGETVVVQPGETDYILKTVDKPMAQVGETVTYTIRAHNPKAIPLTQVSIYDIFDDRLTDLQLISTTHGLASFVEGTLIVKGFTLQPDEEATIVVSARIASLRAGETIPNAAILESPDASIHVSNLTLLGNNPAHSSGDAAHIFVIPGQLPATGEAPLWRGLLIGLGLLGVLLGSGWVYGRKRAQTA